MRTLCLPWHTLASLGHSPRTGAAFVVLTLLLAASPALAQQRIQETVVVTASASPIPFENLARTVTVLTREQIARLPIASVVDALRVAASLDVRARGAFGAQTDFAIRGAGFGQTLVLVDGVRINDLQSGHHNGDIPVRLEDIERIEVLYGSGSSLYGADAFGGTINVITRRPRRERAMTVRTGDFGLAEGSLDVGFTRGRVTQSLGATLNRSSGFMTAREFATVQLDATTLVGPRTRISLGWLRKAFGANGFYGPAPSKEWTNQTLATLEQRVHDGRRWRVDTTAWYRTHGDRFVYDVTRPALSDNRHRTHAVGGQVKARVLWSERTTVNLGGEMGGDWIRSNNLGVHALARGSGFIELQQRASDGFVLYPGLRFDQYAEFGGAWSPSLATSYWLASGVRLRGSVGRAFRVPTFTERYYSDPNHQAQALLAPERAWSVEAGADWLPAAGWLASLTTFSRRERDVIDWVRASPAERWRTTNIRRVETTGIEVGLQRTWGAAFVDGQYAYLNTDPGPLEGLSKYVLEYARHALSVSASTELPFGLSLGQRLGYTRRVDGRRYWVLDARVSRLLRGARLYVEASNLLNTRYQEIRGVDMPPRWIQVGIQVPAF